MPAIEGDLHLNHADAGNLFLALAVGNGIGLLLNGVLSGRLNHRRTVGVSALLVGLAALSVSMSSSYAGLLGAVLGMGVCVGLYLPSGISTITSLVRKEDWGKTLATHEVAPNLAYLVAPVLAEGILFFTDWRQAFLLLGILQLILGAAFLRFGRGGDMPGHLPTLAMVKSIAHRPLFWLMVIFFSMAVGISVGPYAMMPLYLVDIHGYTREEANHLLAVSRVAALFMPFVAGIITDRWGARRAVLLYLLLAGSSTLFLGVASGGLLVTAVVAQPVCSTLFFAPGFTMISRAFSPKERSVVVSMMGPLNACLGVGLAPALLGYLGDLGRFDLGFLFLGGVLMLSATLLPLLPGGKAGDDA